MSYMKDSGFTGSFCCIGALTLTLVRLCIEVDREVRWMGLTLDPYATIVNYL